MYEELSFFPEAASSFASQVDSIYLFLVGISAFFSALIAFAVILFSIRYRRRKGVAAEQIEGSMALEALWSGIPLAIALFTFGWGAKVFLHVVRAPDEGMEFFVTGKQWMWKIQHPTGHREINAMHVPVGQTIVLTMTSEDVIHDFYVPAFRTKSDVVPGMYTKMWFQPTKVGRYHLFCAEYCGTKHSEMIGEIVVMEPTEYEAWLSGQPAAEDPVTAGKVLFENLRCDTCHAAGAQQRGPRLEGLFGESVRLSDGQTLLFDEAYVRESILEPNRRLTAGYTALMPTYEGQVTEDQILQLIAYIKSLGQGEEANQ